VRALVFDLVVMMLCFLSGLSGEVSGGPAMTQADIRETYHIIQRFLTWCAGTDVFAANARPRPLAPRTVKLRRDQIHAAVTALVESGVKMSTIKSLAALVTVPSGMRLEFGGGISDNMRLSFQAARSIG
jgi:hypothetical protein